MLRKSGAKAFSACLTHLNKSEVGELTLGKNASEQLAEIEQLHKTVNRHSYSRPPIRFNELDVNQPRAAGVLIESERALVIVDRSLYRELAKQALARTVEQLCQQAERLTQQRKTKPRPAGGAGADDGPAARAAELKREHGRELWQLAVPAHGVNLDLGWALRIGLSTVDP